MRDNNRPTRHDTIKAWRKKIKDLKAEECHQFRILRPPDPSTTDPSQQDTEERKEARHNE